MKLKKILLLVIGGLLVFVGLIGLLLPVIPQIPFLAAGLVCLMMGSRRFSDWVKKTDFYQKRIKAYISRSRFLSDLLKED